MADVYCLFCNRKLTTRSNDISASRCGKCGSSDLILVTVVNSIADEVAKYMDHSMPSTVSYLQIMNVMVRKFGLRLRPISTIRLLSKIHEILQQTWKKDMLDSISIAGDGDRGI